MMMWPEDPNLWEPFFEQRVTQHEVDISRLWRLFPLQLGQIGGGDGVLPEPGSSSSSSSSSSTGAVICSCGMYPTVTLHLPSISGNGSCTGPQCAAFPAGDFVLSPVTPSGQVCAWGVTLPNYNGSGFNFQLSFSVTLPSPFTSILAVMTVSCANCFPLCRYQYQKTYAKPGGLEWCHVLPTNDTMTTSLITGCGLSGNPSFTLNP